MKKKTFLFDSKCIILFQKESQWDVGQLVTQRKSRSFKVHLAFIKTNPLSKSRGS